MQVYEYDETGACVDSFEVDPRDVVGSWLEHTNRRINRMIDQMNADCILDYWSRKDPNYVNGWAPMMGYMECHKHGPQIGSRVDYPHKGTSPETLCPECGEELVLAIQKDPSLLAKLSG